MPGAALDVVLVDLVLTVVVVLVDFVALVVVVVSACATKHLQRISKRGQYHGVIDLWQRSQHLWSYLRALLTTTIANSQPMLPLSFTGVTMGEEGTLITGQGTH